MDELHSVSLVLADTRSHKAEVHAAAQRKSEYISQLSTSLQALLLDDKVSQVIEFLSNTGKRISLGYFRDQERRGWYLVLTGSGLKKFENYETIPFEGGSTRLSHSPRTVDLNSKRFAELWTDGCGEHENTIAEIKTRIIETAESYANEMLEKKRRANRPSLFQRLGALIFG